MILISTFWVVFFSNDRKNNLEIPVLLIVLKVFKEFVQQDLPTEVQKLHINYKLVFYFTENLL